MDLVADFVEDPCEVEPTSEWWWYVVKTVAFWLDSGTAMMRADLRGRLFLHWGLLGIRCRIIEALVDGRRRRVVHVIGRRAKPPRPRRRTRRRVVPVQGLWMEFFDRRLEPRVSSPLREGLAYRWRRLERLHERADAGTIHFQRDAAGHFYVQGRPWGFSRRHRFLTRVHRASDATKHLEAT